MIKNEFEIKYIYEKDDQALEEVFTYIFDEIQKVINSRQIDEQKISIHTTAI